MLGKTWGAREQSVTHGGALRSGVTIERRAKRFYENFFVLRTRDKGARARFVWG
jgi:hypothetical protein